MQHVYLDPSVMLMPKGLKLYMNTNLWARLFFFPQISLHVYSSPSSFHLGMFQTLAIALEAYYMSCSWLYCFTFRFYNFMLTLLWTCPLLCFTSLESIFLRPSLCVKVVRKILLHEMSRATLGQYMPFNGRNRGWKT